MEKLLFSFGLKVLACPICGKPLRPIFKKDVLTSLQCTHCHYYFSVKKGIIKLLPPRKVQKKDYRKHLAIIAKTYDKYSDIHDIAYHNPKMEYMRKVELKALRFSKIKGTVLDMGCGTGKYTELLAKEGCNVIAMDVSRKMLEITKKKIVSKGLQSKVLYVHSDADTFPFLDNSLDAIIGIFGVLNHVLKYKSIFKSISRALKPNGLLVFSVLNTYRLQWFIYEIFKKRRVKTIIKMIRNRDGYLKFPVKGRKRRVFCHNYNGIEIQKQLKDAGLEIQKMGGIYLLTYPQFKKEETLELKGIDKFFAKLEDKIRWFPPFNMLGYYVIVIARKKQ